VDPDLLSVAGTASVASGLSATTVALIFVSYFLIDS
jgi:hypothetical protein